MPNGGPPLTCMYRSIASLACVLRPTCCLQPWLWVLQSPDSSLQAGRHGLAHVGGTKCGGLQMSPQGLAVWELLVRGVPGSNAELLARDLHLRSRPPERQEADTSRVHMKMATQTRPLHYGATCKELETTLE